MTWQPRGEQGGEFAQFAGVIAGQHQFLSMWNPYTRQAALCAGLIWGGVSPVLDPISLVSPKKWGKKGDLVSRSALRG